MQINSELIESLLWEPEGTTLDFKSQQYPFAGATDDQKSELLKDILAFANAFRREDAFILIGVKDIKGGRAEVVGVAAQLEDAHLQQLVSSNVQRPLSFSYRATACDGKPLGMIYIPRQKRPFYCKGDYGKLKKGAVYVRRGSATEIAMPDEIAAMGADHFASQAAEPILEFSLFERTSGRLIGDSLRLRCLALDPPAQKDIPDYRKSSVAPFRIEIGHTNSNYYRELTEFTCLVRLVSPVSFSITNSGDVTAHDVRLIFDIEDTDDVFHFCDESDIPEPPRSEISPADLLRGAHLPAAVSSGDISVTRIGKVWTVECSFGKIQPKDTVRLSDDLFSGSVESKPVILNMKMFADNLSCPVTSECCLTFDVERRTVTLDDVKRLEYERFANTPRGKKLLEEMPEPKSKKQLDAKKSPPTE